MEFKIIICGKSIYQEVELKEDTADFKIGTHKGCKVRLRKERIPVDFELQIQKVNGKWQIICSEAVCVQAQNGNVGYGCIPQPGNKVMVLEAKSRKELFRIDYFQDFPLKNVDYNYMIDYADKASFTIGGINHDITIKSQDIQGDYVLIRQEQDTLMLNCSNCKIGIFVNGLPTGREQIRLHNKDFFSVKGYQFYIYDKVLYTTSDGSVSTSLNADTVLFQKNHFQYPKFIRNVRQQYVLPKDKIDVLDPKAAPTKPQKNFLASMVPTMISMLLMLLMRSMMGRNGMYMMYSGVMMGMGIVTSAITYKVSGKEYREDMKHREEVYRKYISEQEEKIQELRNKEYSLCCEKSPSIEKDIAMVADFDARLFEKEKEHDDYLQIYIGSGVVKSNCPVSYKKQEYIDTDDIFMEYPKAIAEKYDYISGMPVTLSLRNSNALGFVGDRNALYEMAKNLIINLSVEHFYQDVKLFFVLESEDVEKFAWARWLQNTQMGDCDFRNFMFDNDSDKIALEYLYSQLSERDGLKENELKNLPDMVVFIYRSERIANHPIMQYVEKASKLHFTFIFFEEYEELLNYNCEKKIYLNSENQSGIIQDVDDGENIQTFEYEVIPQQLAEMTAIKLSCVYIDEVSLESSLTKNITLFELLGIQNADELDLMSRWNQSKIYESMAAPLGVKSGGDVVSLDIHEKFHGPHGLVAGTTGSGKSEIIQSYILSLATLFHPHEVGFMIIDFKGGGMANQFKDLPHMLGSITNIDGNEIERSLKSIKAELMKRQAYFAEFEVNHIDDYIKLTKQGKTKQPLPHLLLIVDEFAELKAEQPEFMKELISTARVGRSLGVHLILATQKPSGVVNDQIWSNSKFKLCLKVQDKSDSNEVLKSPLAAEIREPGRAYLQVGNNEIFQLFQSAYSGAPVPNKSAVNTKKFKITKVELSGARKLIYEQSPTADEGNQSQLDAVVDYITGFCAANQIKKLPKICLPALSAEIPYGTYEYTNSSSDICIPYAVLDDPSNQKQFVVDLNITANHTIVIGSSLYGKTNFLQVVLRGLCERYSSDDVQIYILDFGSMILRNFEKINHVAGVILSSDDDKLKGFYKLISEEIEKRKQILAELGLSSFSSYRESGQKELKQIVVMIDNIAALRELYPEHEDALLAISRDGSSLGISLIATARQNSGTGYKIGANLANKIVMYCNDPNEYMNVLGRSRVKLDAIPGRCVITYNKTTCEGQVFAAFSGEKEFEKLQEIRKLVDYINQHDTGKGSEKLPEMPEKVTAEYLAPLYSNPYKPYSILLGLNFDTLEPDSICFQGFPVVGMYGNSETAKIGYLKYVLNFLHEKQAEAPVHIHVFDNWEKELGSIAGICDSYVTDTAAAETTFKELVDLGEERRRLLAENPNQTFETNPFELIVMNSKNILAYLGNQEELMMNFRSILSKNKVIKVGIIVSDYANEKLLTSKNQVLKMMSECNNYLIFDKLNDIVFADFKTSVKRKYEKNLERNDMIFRCGDYVAKYRVPEME